ncbi:MAG: substrate-binding domain-containing protein [Clostridiales bacterium]|jgi:simple sugar transport system substrate-binding protein|nr:substrate-binding domain-containing protein [Clostridiales bacterium]
MEVKKLAAIILALALVFALAACTSTPAAEPADDPAPPATEETAPAPEPEPAAESDGGLISVGIINNPPSESGYREANVKDFERVFSAENGYDAKTYYSLKLDEQLNAAQQFITEGVDYLLIAAADTDGWDAILGSAQEAGIKVFLFDRMINCDESLYESAVVSDMANEGDTAVAWLVAQNLAEYNVIHIQGAMGSDAQRGRTGALDEQFASGAMNKVVQQTATWDEAEAKKIVEAVINSGDSFNVIYAENDGMAKGAVAALDEAGITHGVDGDVIIMGFDCNTWALEELLNGNWNYDGQCSPFQADVIDGMIKNGVTAKKVISEEKGFDATTITQADVDAYGL